MARPFAFVLITIASFLSVSSLVVQDEDFPALAEDRGTKSKPEQVHDLRATLAILNSMSVGKMLRAVMRTESNQEIIFQLKGLLANEAYLASVDTAYHKFNEDVRDSTTLVTDAMDKVVRLSKRSDVANTTKAIIQYFAAAKQADQNIANAAVEVTTKSMDSLPKDQKKFLPVLATFHEVIAQPLLKQYQSFENIISSSEEDFCPLLGDLLKDHQELSKGEMKSMEDEIHKTEEKLHVLLAGIVLEEEADKTWEVMDRAAKAWGHVYHAFNQRSEMIVDRIGHIAKWKLNCKWDEKAQ